MSIGESRQLISDTGNYSDFNLIGTVTIYSFLSILILQFMIVLLTSNRGEVSFALWHNVSYLTFIHWIPLINLNQSSELSSFFSQVAQIFRPFSFPSFCSDGEITSVQYTQVNLNSCGFINNAKEMFLIYSFIMICCISLIIANRYSKKAVLERIISDIKWNVLIRLHLVVYLEFIAYSSVNLNFYSSTGSCATANLVLSLFFIISGGVLIIYVPIAIKQKVDNMQELHPSIVFRSISTLVNEFKEIFDSYNYQYYTLFLSYRFSLGLCLVFLENSPSVQVFMILGFQMLSSNSYTVGYLIFSKPFKYRYEAVTVFLTELFSFFLILTVGLRSMHSISDSLKYYASIFCICNIWVTEACICARFALRLIKHRPDSLSSVQVTTNPAAIITAPQVDQKSFDANSYRSNKFSEHSVDAIHDVTEMDHVSVFTANDAYRFGDTQKKLGKPGLGIRKPGLGNSIGRNADRIKSEFEFNPSTDRSAFATKNIIESAEQTHNLPDPNIRRRLETAEEMAKIKQFLSNLSDKGIRVGNKGLN